MANSEEAHEHSLAARHLAGCLALSKSAKWNQNEADWRLMLELGRGYGLSLADGTLAASTLTLPYGERFAWVSMVLVLPEHRRKGYATQLLKGALEDLSAEHRMAVLDATPAGREVYAQEGFRDTWGFRRHALRASPGADEGAANLRVAEKRVVDINVRPSAEADWEQVLALDAPAFGASRERLLRALARRLPAAALVAERAGQFVGFLLGRDGREATQLGPLVARDADAAKALLAAALPRVAPPIYLDVVEREGELRAWLEARGFESQRPFTRMVHGADRAPGDASLVFCPAGPELG
ncbi:MAG: GNAT family N-acetyltransferase [Burkholderiales bacterium]|nr:GNAT family N-acetyltransferase [Burkholderiales bacterium]